MNEAEQTRDLQDEAATQRHRVRAASEAAKRIAKLKAELNGIRSENAFPDPARAQLLGVREA